MTDLEKVNEVKLVEAKAEQNAPSWLGTRFHEQIKTIKKFQYIYI